MSTSGRSTEKRRRIFQMRITEKERNELKIAAAFNDASVSEYLWGLHEARSRGEIMPGGALIIRAALELADAANQAAEDLARAGYPRPSLRQSVLNLRSTIEAQGRPIRVRRKNLQ